MLERVYQVKEVLEHCRISRDALKYYERCGFIEPKREVNRYRYYNEADVQMLKRIIDFRGLGFSIDETKALIECEHDNEKLEAISKAIESAEAELKVLERRLCNLKKLEKNIARRQGQTKEFHVEYDIDICIDCPRIREEIEKRFFVWDGYVIEVDATQAVQSMRKAFMVQKNLQMMPKCEYCSEHKHSLKKVFKGIIPYGDQAEFELQMKRVYELAKEQGHVLDNKIFAMKKVFTKNQEAVIMLDVVIPIKE